ncbi:hypothetical protein [Psychrobacillus lasiicapitis]|uniref:Outer membrane protein assembly factor BamE n=1 Tax=Psychrobacillus lasiicapitis TaxID=1636719 RepID=A0A544TI03_9BACI|nr:hypothetical protein [Psychrobacillus lasiicapitis]TQR17086.1 hypothetical protein FG382_02760 [Psychrobacillus lasiicapitis]GGA24652.1 hypothetical protein GCM10011384_12280 [Psychrobacillus lasiicapitis]
MINKNYTLGILATSVFVHISLYIALAFFISFFFASYSLLSISAVLLPLISVLVVLFILWKRSTFTNELKGKILLLITAVLCFLPSLFLVNLLGKNEEKLNFTIEKWVNEPDDRAYFVYDFLDEYEMVGKSKEDIQKLLGEPDENHSYSPTENVISYFLGPEVGWISIDGTYLVIWFDDGKQAIDYAVETY